MKITHFVKHFYPCVGGVENHVYFLSKYLSQNNIKTEIVTLDTCYRSSKRLRKVDYVNEIKVNRVRYLNFNFVYKVAPFILKYTKDTDILLVHCHDFFVDFLVLTKWIHHKKIVVVTHGGIFHTKKNRFIKKFYFNIWSKLIFRFVDRILAVSKSDFKIYKKLAKNITLIESPIEPIKKLKIKKIKNSFLYIGRLSLNKRVDNLIKTFAKIKGVDYKLIIAGRDEYKVLDKLKYYIERNNMSKKIIIYPEVSESKKVELYNKAEYFVSASEYEGFGLTLLEAMSVGLIPIVQKNNSFVDLVKNGVTGYLIDYNKHESAAKNLKQIISLDNSSIKYQAYKYSKNYFWDNKIKIFLEFFHKL